MSWPRTALGVVLLVAGSLADIRGQAPLARAPESASAVEQTTMGAGPAPRLVASFDGLGEGFSGPQGSASLRNPSDNSLAVGPDHIVQTVNSRMAIFTKAGARFAETGRPLYGPVNTNHVFNGFGGACEARNNGDAVVRYDQIAGRWLIVMPVFTRADPRPDQPPVWTASARPYLSPPGRTGQPGPAVRLVAPPQAVPTTASPPTAPPTAPRPAATGPYSMCYAVSTGADPFGPYYRYEFLRPLFPDYPRPALWTDGYYVPTSTGDEVIQKHACVVERDALLRGRATRELCFVIDGVNFLNNADVDGRALPPAGAPNVMLAAGGTQLHQDLDDDVVLQWSLRTNWRRPEASILEGPRRLPVAPYHYLCGGQLTNCVPQPGADRRLDAQGDKLMARVVYRRVGRRESMVAVHSVDTAAGGGGVRWYELLIDQARAVSVAQQGTYAPDGRYRWMASPAIDKAGNIGIGYSFGGPQDFAGQRFAGRTPMDPPGVLGLAEAVLVDGQAAQTTTMRWEDYTQTALDPADDCTIWYVGDYLRAGASTYSSRIGAFQLPGCGPAPPATR